MKAKLSQKISRLIDEDLSSKQQEKLFIKIAQGKQLRKKWEHYQIIRRSINHDFPKEWDDVELSQNIHQALKQEPPIEKESDTSTQPARLKPLLWASVASIVAVLVVIIGWHLLR